MMKFANRIKLEDFFSNEDDHSTIIRYPRRKFPLTLIVIIIGIYFSYSFLSSVYIDVQDDSDLVSSSLPAVDETLLTDTSNATKMRHFISTQSVDDVRSEVQALDSQVINEVVRGMTPMMLAASTGNTKIIDLLFSNGADPNKRGSMNRTALQYATEKNHYQAAERLLSYGAEIDAYDNGRMTPLIMAANRGYTELGLLFIKKGADLDIQHMQGWTALIDAAIRNDERLVNALLEAGVNKNIATKNGMKAIDYARQYGHENMVILLSR